jgi:replication factor C subunit 2/4
MVFLQAIEALLSTSEGDMRKAITTLQSTARLKGDERITKQDVLDIAGVCASTS